MWHLVQVIRSRVPSIALGLGMILYGGSTAWAQTVNDFEGGGTPVTLEGFGVGAAPTVEAAGGNPGAYLQLTQAVNDSHNWATFDQTDDPGAFDGFATSTFSFDFNIAMDAVPTADGFSFSYANTDVFGTVGGVGVAPFTAESPATAGVLGFSFDTWSNGVDGFDEDIATGTDYNDITVFWNGGLVERVWDTRTVLDPPLTLDDGAWHTVEGTVDYVGQTVSMNVDGNPVLSDLSVPGLFPFPSRVMFAGRTGGENEDKRIDNLNVQWQTPTDVPPSGPQPEPTQGNWSVREWRPGVEVNGTAGADAIISDPAFQTTRYTTDGMAPMLNFNDPNAGGGGYTIPNLGPLAKRPFLSNTPADDQDIVMRGIAKVIIPEDGQYTFGIDGDDGTRLTVQGADFTYQGGTMGGGASGEVLEFPENTGNAFSLASTFMAAGEYDVELVWQERAGGAFVEVFAAEGVKTEIDGDFAPVGLTEEIPIAGGSIPTTVGQWDVRNVDAADSFPLNNLADARTAVELPNVHADVTFAIDDTADTINYVDPDTNAAAGRFTAGAGSFIGGTKPDSPDQPFPAEFPGFDDQDMALLATVTVSIPEANDYIFGFGSDDGASLTLEGADFTILNPGAPRAVTDDGQTMEFNANTGNSDTFGTTFLEPGEYDLEFLTWERAGGAWAEVYAGVGSNPIDVLTARLLGSPAESISPIIIPAGLQLGGEGGAEPLDGDYNNNGRVEQQDLDLVLLNWGQPFDTLPETWENQRPTMGIVDQAELDGVLLNWGNAAALGTAAVPEPTAVALLLVAAGLGLGLIRKR